MYDQAETITNNFAIVKKGNNWGIVKLDNTELIPFEYKSINIFDKKYIAILMNTNITYLI